MTNGSKRRILVLGGTGAQGGSVARHLLRRGEFDVRVLTRTPGSTEAAALRALGAEVVRGDLFEPATIDAALENCYGAFGVTSYWEHFERESEHGANLVDAAARAGIEHLVLSTLPPVREETGGELNVPHFDIKAETAERARELGIPATYVQLAFYYDNFATFFTPQRQQDGTYRFGFPQGDTKLAGFAVEDTGGIVAPIFERRDAFLGRSLYLVGDDLTPQRYADIMSRVTDTLIRYRHVPRDVFAAYGFRGAADLADMFHYYRTRVPHRQQDLLHSRELYPELQGFEAWAWRHLRRLEQVLAA
jgi:uncharacterized protein YbjT (DUF2867 family)